MSQGCWTCRDRKVRCDLHLPTCSSCARAKRECRYGLRLAWPRQNDRRRTKVYEPYSTNQTANENRTHSDLFFVNSTSEDVGSYLRRSQSPGAAPIIQYDTDQHDLAFRHIQSLPMSKSVTWSLLDEKGRLPLNYYVQMGACFFASNQGEVLAPILLKIALSDSSVPSTALLHAILGLSSSQMGRHEEAFAYRSSAAALLSSSLGPKISLKVSFQNIATSMLLCMFEVYYVSHTSINWAMYLCGIKNIILDALTKDGAGILVNDEECIALRDWVYYFEVLARFSLTHWVGEPTRLPICYEGPKSKLIQAGTNGSLRSSSSTIGYSIDVFDSISDACGLIILSKPVHSIYKNSEQQAKEIELRLRLIKSETNGYEDGSLNSHRISVRLYMLAALIYLNRIGLSYTGEELYHGQLVEEALQLLTCVYAGDVPWPFFIVGCEARTDDQRRKIKRLELASARRRPGGSKRTPWLIPLVERFWSQDDLDQEMMLSYVDKMSTVISTTPFLPAFV